MKSIKNLGAILGLALAINTILALIVDTDSKMGRFYERTWHHFILGKNVRPNVYDPFATGAKYMIFHEDNLSHVSRDYEAIRQAVGGSVYIASNRHSYNGDQPQGVIAFSDRLSDAKHISNLMAAAVRKSKPNIKVKVDLPKGSTVTVASGGIETRRISSLEEFCRQRYQTYTPEPLCF